MKEIFTDPVLGVGVLTVIVAIITLLYNRKTYIFTQRKQDFEQFRYAMENIRTLGTLSDIEKTKLFNSISVFKGLTNDECISILKINLYSKINSFEFNKLCYLLKIKMIELSFDKDYDFIRLMEKYRSSKSFILFNNYKIYSITLWSAFLIYLIFIILFVIDIGFNFYHNIFYTITCMVIFIAIPEVYMLNSLEKRKQMEWYELNKTKFIIR